MRTFWILYCFFFVLFLPNAIQAADYFVSVTGSDSNNCSKSSTPCRHVKAALKQIPIGTSTIKIATGNYLEEDMEVPSYKYVTFEGGWNTNFSNHNGNFTGTTIVAGNKSSYPILFSLSVNGNGRQAGMTIRYVTIKKRSSGNITEAVSINANEGAKAWLTIQHTRITGFTDNAVSVGSENKGIVEAKIHYTNFDNNPMNSLLGLVSSFSNSGTVTLDMKNVCLIDNGTTQGYMAPVYIENHGEGIIKETLQNVMVTGNQTGGWSTMDITSWEDSVISLILINDTVNNAAAPFSFDLSAASHSASRITLDVKNTILCADNCSGSSRGLLQLAQMDQSTFSFTADYCILDNFDIAGSPTYHSSHEIHGDPLLNATSHLQKGSAAIDTGICGEWTNNGSFYLYKRIAPYDDIDGDNRPGFGKIFGCDIGADEFKPFPWPMFLPAIVRPHLNPYTIPTTPRF